MIRRSVDSWMAHDAQRMGAAIAFYTLLSFAPLLILLIAISSRVIGGTEAEGRLLQHLSEFAGPEAAGLAKSMIQRASTPSSGIPATLLGIATLLLGASGVFGELRSAINTMWEIPPRNGGGIRQMIRDRILSIGMVLGIGALLVASVLVSAILAGVSKYLGSVLPVPAGLLELVNFLVSFASSSLLFALVMRYIPDVRLPWRYLLAGSVVTAFLFTIGKSLIGLYLGRSAVGSPYGPGGAVVVTIVWVYYSAQIFLFGAELTQAFAEEGGTQTTASLRPGVH